MEKLGPNPIIILDAFQIRQMFPIIANSAQKLTEYIGYCVEQKNQKTLNTKDVSKLTLRDTYDISIEINDADFYSFSF